MKAKIQLRCEQCELLLGGFIVDTADMPNELQDKINRIILGHRAECPYYTTDKDIETEYP